LAKTHSLEVPRPRFLTQPLDRKRGEWKKYIPSLFQTRESAKSRKHRPLLLAIQTSCLPMPSAPFIVSPPRARRECQADSLANSHRNNPHGFTFGRRMPPRGRRPWFLEPSFHHHEGGHCVRIAGCGRANYSLTYQTSIKANDQTTRSELYPTTIGTIESARQAAPRVTNPFSRRRHQTITNQRTP
jgi:hypothetical protein